MNDNNEPRKVLLVDGAGKTLDINKLLAPQAVEKCFEDPAKAEEKKQGWEWRCGSCPMIFSTRRLLTETEADRHFAPLVVSHKRSGCAPLISRKEGKKK